MRTPPNYKNRTPILQRLYIIAVPHEICMKNLKTIQYCKTLTKYEKPPVCG
ncbi:hypothetical protein ANACOL_04331 [Anaerotruncus colihominis DSM 17241]|uniref:Uncharacterized protein n=1 Tax=Anaerotruncus colihominis DSM 17241 TaxID=445972 RepID=B0PHN8_9FIRM|nr:hypothetical protein ANACOL_04331 [Anaerotruncus colihominis DSM 17241]